MTIVLFGIWGCSEEESDIDIFYGEWNALDSRTTLTNGVQGLVFIEKYFFELNIDNCGTKYNLDREETAKLKWLFNEGIERPDDHFLLSVQTAETNGLSNLGKDNLYFVMKLSEEEILLSRSKTRTSQDTTFKTIWNLRLTKE